MNFHSVFNCFFVGIVVSVPEEPEEISMVFTNHNRMKHLFDVCHERGAVEAEA